MLEGAGLRSTLHTPIPTREDHVAGHASHNSNNSAEETDSGLGLRTAVSTPALSAANVVDSPDVSSVVSASLDQKPTCAPTPPPHVESK